MNPRYDIVVDMQFGSTGKGLLAQYLAENNNYDAVMTAWGPNAGHTSVIEPSGERVVRTMVANSASHSPSIKSVFVAPGSMLSVDNLLTEWASTRLHNPGVTMFIHPHAAVVTSAMVDAERQYAFKIGSTQKGTGEAVIAKIRRQAGQGCVAIEDPTLAEFHPGIQVCSSGREWEAMVRAHNSILVEGVQGFSLGLNSGFWPHCTSRECTAAQLMSDCLIPRTAVNEVYGVCRTFPIRVANRYNANGEEIGNSGPCYHDQREMTWEEVGQPAEYTTVTKLVRRVFSFSEEQVVTAAVRSGITKIMLNFVNYLPDDKQQQFVDQLKTALYNRVEYLHGGGKLELLGYGPLASQIRRA